MADKTVGEILSVVATVGSRLSDLVIKDGQAMRLVPLWNLPDKIRSE